MKVLTFASVFVLCVFAQASQAQDRSAKVDQASRLSQTSTTTISQNSAAMADAAREKAEALERSRDRRLKRTTRSICSGC